MKAFAIVGGSLLAVVLVIVMMSVGYHNRSVNLQESIKASQTACKIVYDETWKKVQQDAQITGKYAEDFKQVYTELMNGRYQGGTKSFITLIHENHPQLSDSVYTNLQNTVDAARTKFANEQKSLVDKNREYEAFKRTIPANFFVGNDPAINIAIVTSEKTDQAFSTGQENDISLFTTNTKAEK